MKARANLTSKLWRDERGALLSIEMILVASVVALGTIVGLATFRDALVQELGDVAAGLAMLNHGYQFVAVSKTDTLDNIAIDLFVAGSTYSDLANFGEPVDPDPVGSPPMCITFTDQDLDESGT